MKISELKESSIPDEYIDNAKDIIKQKGISKGKIKPFVKDESIVIFYWTDKTTARKLVIEGTRVVTDEKASPSFEVIKLESEGYQEEDNLYGFFKKYGGRLNQVINDNKEMVRYGGLGIIILIGGLATFFFGGLAGIVPSLAGIRTLFSITEDTALPNDEQML